MKKIISLSSLLAVGAAALTPVLMTQNMPLKSTFGYTPPPRPSGFTLNSKFDFNNDASKHTISSHAQYYTMSGTVRGITIARFQAFLSPSAATAMWKFTTHGPDTGHPASNYIWWLNDNVAGFGAHINQVGDYLITIYYGYQNQNSDESITDDFEKNIGGSLWNKIEAYFKSKSNAQLELSFQYNGELVARDGFYTNASWPH